VLQEKDSLETNCVDISSTRYIVQHQDLTGPGKGGGNHLVEYIVSTLGHARKSEHANKSNKSFDRNTNEMNRINN